MLWFWLLIAVHVILCPILIFLVLIQNDRAGGLSSVFGGGGGQTFTAAGAATAVSTATRWVAVTIFAVVLGINLLTRFGGPEQGAGSQIQQLIENQSAAQVLIDEGAPLIPGAGGAPGIPGVPVVPGVPLQPPAPAPAESP